jgi:hypothetical protein
MISGDRNWPVMPLKWTNERPLDTVASTNQFPAGNSAG